MFAGFVNSCVATPNNCALAGGNITAAELNTTIYNMLEDLKYNPIVLASSILDYSAVKSIIVACLYSPALWPLLSTGISAILTKNAALVEQIGSVLSSGSDPKLNEYIAGIECSEKATRASKLVDIIPFVDRLYEKSTFSDIQTQMFTTCATWKMEAKERYAGDFQVKTRNPIMLIGNTYDPVTPLVSAKNVSAGFEGSVVLQHNGYGVRILCLTSFPLSNFYKLIHSIAARIYTTTFFVHGEIYPRVLCERHVTGCWNNMPARPSSILPTLLALAIPVPLNTAMIILFKNACGADGERGLGIYI